ncbi:MAG: hypothetical protein ACLPZR_10710 [Solirubrobacteraceae bacterium]
MLAQTRQLRQCPRTRLLLGASKMILDGSARTSRTVRNLAGLQSARKSLNNVDLSIREMDRRRSRPGGQRPRKRSSCEQASAQSLRYAAASSSDRAERGADLSLIATEHPDQSEESATGERVREQLPKHAGKLAMDRQRRRRMTDKDPRHIANSQRRDTLPDDPRTLGQRDDAGQADRRQRKCDVRATNKATPYRGTDQLQHGDE